MAMSKVIRVLEKSIAPSPHSVLLEHRNKTDCILFESHVCALLTQQENVIRKQYTKVCMISARYNIISSLGASTHDTICAYLC